MKIHLPVDSGPVYLSRLLDFMPAAFSPTTPATLSIALGSSTGGGVVTPLGLPVLRGPAVETLFSEANSSGRSGPFTLLRTGTRLIGLASIDPRCDLEQETLRLYASMIEAAKGWHLCRIWNYVPDINADQTSGMENYRAFSAGRSVAFESALGQGFTLRLPAASAVGSRDGRLTVLFVAAHQPASHWENTLQIPAYEYPAEYGPRAPSFARASTASADGGTRDVFISGTSAIRGHLTVAPGDTAAQVRCTVENLREMSRACRLGEDFGGKSVRARQARVYLRHAADLESVASELDRALWQPGDAVTYVQADICRADLNVEIEVSVFGAR